MRCVEITRDDRRELMTSIMRLTYPQSCIALQKLGLLDQGELPPLPTRQPQLVDEEPLGVSFFRMQVEGDLANMTLPRTFFGKSEICDASFRDTDLSESTLCWCDFVNVDFSHTTLNASDLRASNFERVRFDRFDLHNTDLRRSTFKACSFEARLLDGAKLTRTQARALTLSPQQLAAIDWQTNEDDELGGG